MKIEKGNLEGVYIITLEPNEDERGYFMRVYDDKLFSKEGIDFKWVQANHSKSNKKGTIRGLHFQLPPFAETKLVRCIKGTIQDVYVDLRNKSNTFGKWESIILSERNCKCILIPKGFAHGFCTLEDHCEVIYNVDNYYSKEHERGLLWNDIELKINWDVYNEIVSEKDTVNMTLKEFREKIGGIEI